MKTIFMSLFLCLSSFGLFAQKAGDKLPNVSLKNIDGKSVELKDIVKPGQITVLTFWATWCAPCKKELDNMMDLYDGWQKDPKVQVIAVSIDDARTAPKVKSTVKSKGWDYTVLLDSNEDLKRALNISSVPFSMIVNGKGEIVYQHSGYKDGDEDKMDAKIKELAKKK